MLRRYVCKKPNPSPSPWKAFRALCNQLYKHLKAHLRCVLVWVLCVFCLNKSSIFLSRSLQYTIHIHTYQVTIFHLYFIFASIFVIKLCNLRSYKWYQSPNNDLGGLRVCLFRVFKLFLTLSFIKNSYFSCFSWFLTLF